MHKIITVIFFQNFKLECLNPNIPRKVKLMVNV